jgi:CheY-like chemotaxis protein
MKILAVDDDPVILDLLNQVLHVAGFKNLTVCNSAERALELIHDTNVPFDCFLLDIQMPVTDGIQLTSIIRSIPSHTKTPILMITAMSDRTYIDAAFAAGADDYITKPFEISEIHARMRLIDERVATRKQREDRNPVASKHRPAETIGVDAMRERWTPIDINNVIDYLALENYLVQVSRSPLIDLQVFGVVVPDMEEMFLASSHYEYQSAVSDIAWAISNCLKPLDFFIAHAGSGAFVVVLTAGGSLNAEDYEAVLHNKLSALKLQYCDGRPMNLHPMVSRPRLLRGKSSRDAANALAQAVAEASRKVEQRHTC